MDMLHLFKNGSIISMDFATYGTLLSVILAYKSVSVSCISNNFILQCVVLGITFYLFYIDVLNI